MRHLRTRHLAGYVVAADVLLLIVVLPLQRFALQVAASPESGKPLIAALLAVNVLLLAAMIGAALASCGLTVRVALKLLAALGAPVSRRRTGS